MLVGITVSLEGEANVFFSFFSFRRIRNMRRNSVMKGVSDSQLLLFRVVRRILQVTISVGRFLIYFVEITLLEWETRTSRKGKDDSTSSSLVNWMWLHMVLRCD